MINHIEIAQYNPSWPQDFAVEAEKIKETLKDLCAEVHHIGSTAVPGLIAKPKIDIIAVVKSLDNIKRAFESLGYQYRKEHDMPFRLYFTKKIKPNINLHVYAEHNPEIELNILFRDYLRNCQKACAEYATLKKRLLTLESAHEKNHSRSTGYNLGKNDFIKKIINQTGFAGLCFRPCQHYQEWQNYYRIIKGHISAPVNMDDGKFHFILYKGTEIVCAAQLEFLNETQAVLRALSTDEFHKGNGYASYMRKMLTKWILSQGRHML